MIVELLGVKECTDIAFLGREIVGTIVTYAADNPTSENRQLLGSVGCMPIVSKEYNPHCKISYTAGLIHCFMQKEGITLTDQKDDDGVVHILQPLMYIGDCVDKDVIMGMIDLGTNYVHVYASAVIVARLSSFMLLQEHGDREESIPNDTRIAFAIRTGLVEMCLDLIERFGRGGIVNTNASVFHQHIEHIFRFIHTTVLHQKTAKAIRSKSGSIEEDLARLQQNTSITNNIKCRELLDMIRSIMSLNGLYCCRCNKKLSKTQVKQCNGCHCMSYCSRACQKDDWFNGHKLNCSKTVLDMKSGQFQGRVFPVAMPKNERALTKMKELETNLNMVQLKLFLDNSETILSQASSLNIPLRDCIVKLDLRHCPLEVKVVKYTDIYEKPEEANLFEKSGSKDNITVQYCTYFYDNGDSESEDRMSMQRFFPHEWLRRTS